MIIKNIPYGSAGDRWYTGIAITNGFDGNRIYAEYRDKAGKLIYIKQYGLLPYQIYTFGMADVGAFSAVFYGKSDFEISRVLGTGELPWALDSMPQAPYPLKRSDSGKMIQIPDSPFWDKSGNCSYLRENCMAALSVILREHYLATGSVTRVLDLNQRTGHCENHPSNSHNGTDGDFGYDPDMSIVWRLMRKLLSVYPDSFIHTHETKIWPELELEMTGHDKAKFKDKIFLDTNSEWNHDTHFHFHFGSKINWDHVGI